MPKSCTEFKHSPSKPYCITAVNPGNIIDPVLKERDAIFENRVFPRAPICITEFENKLLFNFFQHPAGVTIWFEVEEKGPEKGISLTAEVVPMGISKDNPEFEEKLLAKFIFSRF